ncbi:MAG: enoyl-CoA hydratase/isomerase family protein [Dehalococcoidia bacterium]|nr:enoyl-CoA hydratase/isomerase family protein [Dehalococcoidia bacterium]
MEYEGLIYRIEDGIARLTFNRPEKLNAFTPSMYMTLIEIFEDVAMNEDARVLVVTGTGRAFCVGADVKTLEEGFAGKERAARTDSGKILTLLLQKMSKPVIAAINGVTAGGGFEIACASDIRIASEKATFSSIFVRRGLLPTLGGTYFLPRLIGIDRACELIWTGDLIDAREAERIGLVTRVVPHDELEAATGELAEKLVKGPPLAISRAKEAIYKGLSMDLESAVHDVLREVAVLGQTEDHREAVNAFLQKRAPVFKGR